MTKPPAPHFFTEEASRHYDERNARLAPISACMHFLIQLALQELPVKSHILCIGVGTGAEVLTLAKAFPAWTFVGVDPSAPMLEVCRQRLADAGISDRCQLIHGYVRDVPGGENFDAALGVIVGHFVPRAEKAAFFGNMVRRLKEGGTLVNTEISFDLDSPEFPAMMKNWGRVQTLMGATPESLEKLPQQMREMLDIFPPEETEELLRRCGVHQPLRVFQAFMICGWVGQKRT